MGNTKSANNVSNYCKLSVTDTDVSVSSKSSNTFQVESKVVLNSEPENTVEECMTKLSKNRLQNN